MSLTLPVHVVVDPALVDPQRLNDLKEKLADFSPVLVEVGAIVEEGLAENFEMLGYGTWAPLARSTWERKDRMGYSGQPPLSRSGALFRALTQRDAPGHKFLVSANELIVGVYDSVIPYAYWLSTGTRRMPARILIQLSPGYVQQAIDKIREWLGGGDGINVYADAPLEWNSV